MFSKIVQAIDKWIDSKIPQEYEDQLKFLRETCNSWGYNEWGYSVDWLKKQLVINNWLYKKYFRVETTGLENLPEGRFMLIGNHSSQMAYDGLLIGTSLFIEAKPPRFLHALVGTFFASSPFYAEFMPRMGQISGTVENCTKLLEEDRCVLVFPEGEAGGGKTIFNSYKLMKFGHGFMKLALETKTPIVPFGFIGGEEMVPSFSRMEPIGKLVGMPYFPLSPTGVFPLPTKCYINFGKPHYFDDDPLDDTRVANNVDKVKTEVEKLISKGLDNRPSIFFSRKK